MILAIILVGLGNAVILALLSVRVVHVFQLGGYRFRPFLKWALSRKSRYPLSLLTIALLGFGGAFVLQAFVNGMLRYLGLLFYLALAASAIVLNFLYRAKVPLRITPRVCRLLSVIVPLCVVSSVAFTWFLADPCDYAVQYLPALSVIVPLHVLLAAVVLWPIETLVKWSYERRAQRKLFSPEFAHVIRIGITGSYGKTTCKNILAEILSTKYKVLASPGSFNTPMGLARTVLSNDFTPETQVLIMEMGARYRGDIAKMCKLFRPQHGILTSVGLSHLATFKTPEAIKAEKFELIKAIPDGGIKILGKSIQDATAGGAGEIISPASFFSSKIKCPLLGVHNQENLDLCAQMALGLGLSPEEIKRAAANLKPIPHRLELTTNAAGVRILDDSYNSCPHGARAALETLAVLKASEKGSRAVVVTPGMVELGKGQDEQNQRFAHAIACVADAVIVVGEVNKRALQMGLTTAKFPTEAIHLAPTITDAMKLFPTLLTKGDILLIENDLPDLVYC